VVPDGEVEPTSGDVEAPPGGTKVEGDEVGAFIDESEGASN
jgi:hypothetical protein